ncbi:MAG: hypothetical protein HYS07_09725 [Chlamydiae bacterium]|nr:hypothetical protein [Chlamydiota bacterium]MBI3277955.1 hypothetical protein [Chlamydiota bacterium]
MTRSLPDFLADLLEHYDAVTEKKEDGTLEALLPQPLSRRLGQSDYLKLRFSYDELNPEAVDASYDSALFTSIASLVEDRGRFARVVLRPELPNVEKLSKVIPEKIDLANATFRLDQVEEKNISYLLLHFKYSGLSDEKVEGILSLLVNEMTLSTIPFESDLIGLSETPERLEGIVKQEVRQVFHAAQAVSVLKVKEQLKDFIISLEKRLNRDVQRVDEYYEILQEEIKKMIERKAVSEVIREERDGVSKTGEINKLQHRLEAVLKEREWKIQDLVSKYALNIRIEPISALRIETPSFLFWINIRRRLSSRPFPITYNPITQQIDPLPCESCFYPAKPYSICDDKLHILCKNCLKTCSRCGKKFCSACNDHLCPGDRG